MARRVNSYYIIYNKQNDEIITTGYAKECAIYLNMTLPSFYSMVTRAKKGDNNKYEIEDNRQFNVDAELERVNRIINQGKQNEEILRQVARNLAMYGLRLEIS